MPVLSEAKQQIPQTGSDEKYMRQALDLAVRAIGRTSPNPMVGALLVRDGAIVGSGWHRAAGTPHAEIHALKEAGAKARGSTLYVTLEPCCHYGRTPPCVDAIIDAGVKRVVAAMKDPNPRVAGKGLARLKAAGLDVTTGVLANAAARLNEVFIKWIATGMPFVASKSAITVDGKTATAAGMSQWITGPEARQRTHELRDRYDAIMVGIGTVLKDDPQLTTRLPQGGRNPVRIILDTRARTPLDAKVISDGQAQTIVAVGPEAPSRNIDRLAGRGAMIMTVPAGPEGVDLRILLRDLGKRGITSVLLEGGSTVNASAFAANIVDKIYWFMAPKIFGGREAPGVVGGRGIQTIDDAYSLEDISFESVGPDILITGYVSTREGRDVYRACGGIGPD